MTLDRSRFVVLVASVLTTACGSHGGDGTVAGDAATSPPAPASAADAGTGATSPPPGPTEDDGGGDASPAEGDASVPDDAGAADGSSRDSGPADAASAGWLSGAGTVDLAAFASWRGRPVNALRFGNCDDNWTSLAKSDCGQLAGLAAKILALEGEGMLPADGSGSFAACATGAYDTYFQSFGRSLVSAGRGASVIALGWEANGYWYPWSFGVKSGNTAATTVTSYIACFRHEAQAIKSTDPAARISWNMNEQSYTGATSVLSAYPGDDVVDEIAVDYYDIDYATTTAAVWAQECGKLQNGGPEGLCAWLAFAQLHGKKLGIPEWGLSTGDDPSYIQQMYAFFAGHVADISYESYFNAAGASSAGSLIYPTTENPDAASAYQRLWASSPLP